MSRGHAAAPPRAAAGPGGKPVRGRRGIGSDASTSLPVYHQLYTILRQQIRDGAFPRGTALPAEMALCRRFDVSRVSVRRALDMLARESLIVRRHGVGTFVTPGPDGSAARLAGLVDNLITLGLETEARLLRFEACALPPYATEAMRLATGAAGLHIQRLRLFQGQPLSLTSVYLPERIAHLLSPDGIGAQPVMQLLEQAGLKPMRAEQSLSAVTADDQCAASLGVPIGAPLIRLRRCVLDAESVPFEFQQGFYNPDRYEYHMELTRDSSGPGPQWRHIG